MLNLHNSWRVFKTAFVGQAHNLSDWLRHEVPQSLRRLAIPFSAMALLLVTGWLVGADQAARYNLPASLLNIDSLLALEPDTLNQLEQTGLISVGGALYIWFHNIRVVILATLAGIFSFGVLGALILMLPMGLLGFLAYSAAQMGLDQASFISAFVLPHGLFELPALAISGAVIFRIGATLVTPSHDQSISESWIRSFADWAKVMLVVIIPLFFVASLVEAFITPRVMWMILGR